MFFKAICRREIRYFGVSIDWSIALGTPHMYSSKVRIRTWGLSLASSTPHTARGLKHLDERFHVFVYLAAPVCTHIFHHHHHPPGFPSSLISPSLFLSVNRHRITLTTRTVRSRRWAPYDGRFTFSLGCKLLKTTSLPLSLVHCTPFKHSGIILFDCVSLKVLRNSRKVKNLLPPRPDWRCRNTYLIKWIAWPPSPYSILFAVLDLHLVHYVHWRHGSEQHVCMRLWSNN